jgi:hypothetical protein
LENPNIEFIQVRKKKVGPIRYKNSIKNRDSSGNRSKKNEKKRNSETKKMDPGKPRNIKVLISTIRKSFGQMKFNPLISVMSLVLNLRAIASTSRNEFVESSA